jgi:hypothetical protein
VAADAQTARLAGQISDAAKAQGRQPATTNNNVTAKAKKTNSDHWFLVTNVIISKGGRLSAHSVGLNRRHEGRHGETYYILTIY